MNYAERMRHAYPDAPRVVDYLDQLQIAEWAARMIRGARSRRRINRQIAAAFRAGLPNPATIDPSNYTEISVDRA